MSALRFGLLTGLVIGLVAAKTAATFGMFSGW